MATTSGTNTGINTINLSAMTSWHVSLMMITSFLGSPIMVALVIVLVRRYYFSKRFEDVLQYNKERKEKEERKRRNILDLEAAEKVNGLSRPKRLRRCISLMSSRSMPIPGRRPEIQRRLSVDSGSTARSDHIIDLIHQFHDYQIEREKEEKELEGEAMDVIHEYPESSVPGIHQSPLRNTTSIPGQGIAFADSVKDQRDLARQRLERSRQLDDLLFKITNERTPAGQPIVGMDDDEEYERIMRQPIKKSQLTREQRYRLGGTEYRALDLLACIVPAYYFGLAVGCGFLYRAYVALSPYCQQVLITSNPTGPTNPWLFSFFLSLSSLNNLGISVLDASMTPFQNAPFPLIVSFLLIYAGNTAFPIFLRFTIWTLYKLTPKSRQMRCESFRYLLDHPRRCFTTLFPATRTWWLLIILLLITLFEVLAFVGLDYQLPVLSHLSWGSRILDGIFQSVSIRNAGFTVVSLADLNPGTQLVYIVAMYISVYPIAIFMRHSNVYQERSLGIYRTTPEEQEPARFKSEDLKYPPFMRLRRQATISSIMTTSRRFLRGPDFFVVQQIQRQLTSDMCWVIVGVFLICVIEAEAIMAPAPITMASVIYECVSAFANAGGSLGYPGTTTSQCAQYHTLSKVILIILMYRGRHRDLPAAIDRAVLLPSEQLEEEEEKDEMYRRQNVSYMDMQNPPKLFYSRTRTI
ncbi:hypothetical protein EC973_001202 [Apophysomyces ossiformis]|uniref:Potassium transport protein n=1 Tax=Apophysomyces ossiformis TaxID=679940 RepID=A0A8H7BI71_9FUNG|nr:hypothetical protein EC973_001202 [Apophysomyces ossiformis]